MRTLTAIAAVGMILALAGGAWATPVQDSSLVLWFDASDPDGDGNSGNNPGDGTNLTTWDDKSASVGDGVANDGTTGTAPSYHTTAGPGSAPVVRFTAASSEWLNIATKPSVPLEFTAFTVASIDGANSDNEGTVLFLGQNNLERVLHFANHIPTPSFRHGRVRENTGPVDITFNATLFNDSTFQLYTAVGDDLNDAAGGTFQLDGYTDGTFDGTASGTLDLSTITYTVAHIGRGMNTTRYLDADISEIILYNRVLTEEERNDVGTYIQTKYGITIEGAVPEPATLSLVALGAVGMVVRRKRK